MLLAGALKLEHLELARAGVKAVKRNSDNLRHKPSHLRKIWHLTHLEITKAHMKRDIRSVIVQYVSQHADTRGYGGNSDSDGARSSDATGRCGALAFRRRTRGVTGHHPCMCK